MKTLLFCAKGFVTMEFGVFIDVLGWVRNDYGYDVTVDTCGFTKQLYSAFGVPIIVDKTIKRFAQRIMMRWRSPAALKNSDFIKRLMTKDF